MMARIVAFAEREMIVGDVERKKGMMEEGKQESRWAGLTEMSGRLRVVLC